MSPYCEGCKTWKKRLNHRQQLCEDCYDSKKTNIAPYETWVVDL